MIRQHISRKAKSSKRIDTLDLAPGVHAVKAATLWLESIGEREQWSAALAFALTLSMDEALTNVVSYAFSSVDTTSTRQRGSDPAPPFIHLRCIALTTQVRIEIIDNGRPYDVTQAAPPALAESLDDAHIGGLGLHLMRHYLSDMSYLRRDGKNYLTLIISGNDSGTA